MTSIFVPFPLVGTEGRHIPTSPRPDLIPGKTCYYASDVIILPIFHAFDKSTPQKNIQYSQFLK